MSAAAFARRVAVASLPCRVPVLSARTRPFSSTTPAISNWGNSVIPSRSACNAGCVAGRRSSLKRARRRPFESALWRTSARCRARSRSRLSRYSKKVAASPTASARSGAVMRMGGGKRMAKLVVIERQRRAAVPNPAVAGHARVWHSLGGAEWRTLELRCWARAARRDGRRLLAAGWLSSDATGHWFRVGAEPIEDGARDR